MPDRYASDCPFCTIARTYQPISPFSPPSSPSWNPDLNSPPTYLVLSTETVIAFLDIAPLTRGHLLVAPRHHTPKLGSFLPSQMSELGRVLPLLARAVTSAVLPDISHDEVDYNVVQNNGPGAAQVVPHVHFHLIPRPPLGYQLPPPTSPGKESLTTTTGKKKYPPSKLPTGAQSSYIQFGRGQRQELDDEDAEQLVQVMRQRVKEEWEREFGSSLSSSSLPTGNAATATAENNSSDVDENVVTRFTGSPEDAAWIEGSGGLVTNLLRRGGGGGRAKEKL